MGSGVPEHITLREETEATAVRRRSVVRRGPWLRRLSERWRWVILSGLLVAAAGASVGWWVIGDRSFVARGSVQFGVQVTTIGTVLRGGERAGEESSAGATLLEAIVEREIGLLQSLVGHPGEVTRSEDSRTRVQLAYEGASADRASAGLQEVLTAYQQQTLLSEESTRRQQLDLAAREIVAARAALSRQQALVDALNRGDGPDMSPWSEDGRSLEAVWAMRLSERDEAKQALAELDRWVTKLEAMEVPSAKEVAAVDPKTATFLARRRAIHEALADLVWPPRAEAATRVSALLSERKDLDQRVEARVADARLVLVRPKDAGVVTPDKPAATAVETGSDVVFRAVWLSDAHATQAEQSLERDRAVSAVESLRPHVEKLRAMQAEARAQADTLEAATNALAVEAGDVPGGLSGVGLGLVQVTGPTGPGDVEVGADNRLAWAGALAGAGLLTGMFLTGMVFLSDGRVRQGRDGRLAGGWGNEPVLGVVPVLGAVDASSTDEAGSVGLDAASDGIEAVRGVLEGRMAAGDSSFAVTGVEPGSGATSVAVGVAASLALSGSRVLLVDLAWLVEPTAGDDAEAVAAGRGIDGVLSELGYLEDEDREQLILAEGRRVGFGALLRGASLRRSVVQTRVDRLGVLSAMGAAQPLREAFSGRLSAKWLSKLMEVARRGGYAATLIDTGAAMTSVEGMLGCAAADGTVVVVSTDQSQSAYDKAVRRLGMMGATVIGSVLNRVGQSRWRRSGGARAAALATRHATGHGGGSGIFAAAVEAKAGRGQHGSGALVSMPFTDEDEAPAPEQAPSVPVAVETPTPELIETRELLESIESIESTESTGAVDADKTPDPEPTPVPPEAAADAQPESEVPTLDLDELETRDAPTDQGVEVGVNPVDEPPARVQPTPARLPPGSHAPAPAAADPGSEAEPPHPDPQTPAPEDEQAPDVHVLDDVMDQLVDHAIRLAERERRKRPESPNDAAASRGQQG